MLILTLQGTELNLTHGSELLQNSSHASLLETEPDALSIRAKWRTTYSEHSISELGRLGLNAHRISSKRWQRAILEISGPAYFYGP